MVTMSWPFFDISLKFPGAPGSDVGNFGQVLDSVEMFHAQRLCWEKLAPMTCPRRTWPGLPKVKQSVS